MNRLVEMKTKVNVETERPSVKFSPDGKKVYIEFAIKSEPAGSDTNDPSHPKRDTHRVLLEENGDLFSGDLSVALFGLSSQGSLMQISMRR